MDPDQALQELREWYNVMQDGHLAEPEGTREAALTAFEMVIALFDDLDNWIIGGGSLPKEWRR